MRLSYVILSHNRREELCRTLAMLPSLTPLPADQWQIWVVDNASTDGTAQAIQDDFPHVNLVRNRIDQGVAAQNHAFTRCAGEFIICLDEASYPAEARNITLLLSHMGAHASIGAVTTRIVGPDGSMTGPQMPSMLVEGAICIRKSILDKTGGYDWNLRGHAAQLDLTCRIWQRGSRVERREDLVFANDLIGDVADVVLHPSTAGQIELRDNLVVAQRFMPSPLDKIYWQDLRLRYEALARHSGGIGHIRWGLWAARIRQYWDGIGGRNPLTEEQLECIFGIRRQAAQVGDWARRNSVWRVVLADFVDNIWATYNACRGSGLQLRCIADETPAFEGLEYRGLPIVGTHEAFEGGGIDGVIIATTNPAQIETRLRSIRRSFKGPILKLWEPPRLATHVRPVAIAA